MYSKSSSFDPVKQWTIVLGNFIDRIFLGYVRDFISISIWPVFNFADIFSTIGVGLLIIKLYKEDKAYKLKSHRRK